MRQLFPIRKVVVMAGVFFATFFVLPTVTQACQVCFWSILNPSRSYCRAVRDRETGTTICTTYIDNLGGSFCDEGGDYCSVITVDGGGGASGGSGGGDDPCQTTGFCPAECFSCAGSGSGGRAV